MTVVQHQESNSSADSALRGERDRFAAFAFCRSDALIELDGDRCIVFAAGATRHLFGHSSDELRGRPIADLVVHEDRGILDGLLGGMLDGRRPRPMILRARPRGGEPTAVSFTGYHLPELERHFFVSFQIPSGSSAAADEGQNEALPNDLEKFATMVTDLLQGEGQGETDAELSLIEFKGFEEFLGRLDPAVSERLKQSIGANLRANSLHGAAATDLGDGKFGILHSMGLDMEAIRSDLEEQTREADPTGAGVEIDDASISLTGANADDQDAARALVTVISRFSRQEGDGFTLVDLSKGLPTVMKSVQQDLHLIRRTIRSGAFSMAFQPICDLVTREVHHYEVLARIDGQEGSPFKFIQSAEELGLIQRFDRVMCQKVMDWLAERKKEGSFYSLAVNLSAKSIGDPNFMTSLEALLQEHQDLRGQVMFEVTESARIRDVRAANEALQRLRTAGHKVCLDDFGVGESSLQDLRQYQVDLVKIDGSYVRDALENPISSHILRAVAAMCRDMEIGTVAEMIEEEPVVDFLRGCGVQYGQGYLFGKPNIGAPKFTPTNAGVPRAVAAG